MKGFGFLLSLGVWAALLSVWFGGVSSVESKPKNVQLTTHLRNLFITALLEHPDLRLPKGLEFPQSATIEEKAASLVAHVMGLAGPELEAWLGESGELLHEIRVALKETNKKSRLQKLKQAFEKFLHAISQLVRKTKTCRQVKDEGLTPEVRLGHSPIPLFGYPVFDVKINAAVFERRLPLNRLNHRNIPIKVGAQDYVVQGSVRKVMEFFDCFEMYKVIGQTLFPDGHWDSEPRDGLAPRPLYLQIQGVMKDGSVAEVLVREALMTVIRQMDLHLKKKGVLTAYIEQALTGETKVGDYLQSKGTAAVIKHLRSYARIKGDQFIALVKEIAAAPTPKEKIEALYRHLQEEETGEDDWSQSRAIEHHRRITVTITTYPSPDSTNKSTKRMPSNKVFLGDIANALREINWDFF